MQRSAVGLQIVGTCSSDRPDFGIQFLITLPRITTEWSKADGLTAWDWEGAGSSHLAVELALLCARNILQHVTRVVDLSAV
jgi:hypothetical protein